MARFIFYEDNKKEWRWRFVADNGRIIADSAESYTEKKSVRNAMRRFVELVGQAGFEASGNNEDQAESK